MLKEVTVYHLGKHTCIPKLDTAQYDTVMNEATPKNTHIGPVALKNLKVNEAVGNGYIDGAYEIAEKFNTGRMKFLTRKPYGFMQSCSVLLPSQIHMTKFTPHLGYFFQFSQRCGKN